MRCRWILTAAIACAWVVATANAQPAATDTTAAADTSKLTVAVETSQGGIATTNFEKDEDVEIVATVRANLPYDHANVLLTLDIADQINIESDQDVVVKSLYIDNAGDGNFAVQPSSVPRARLRFVAPEGQTALTGTQRVKWVISFKVNAARAPLSVTGAATVPPSSEIVAQDRAQANIDIRSVLSVQQLWKDGGIFMWPLGFSLILAIAFALERIWTLSWAKIDTNKFFRQIEAAVRDGGPVKAIEVCNRTRGPVAAVIREGLLRTHQGVDHVEKAIASAGAVEGSFLQRGMVVLSSVTTIAPMIGFLGTVWGMVIAFRAIAEAGDVKPSIVADGISQALITTVTGLIIAMISQSFGNFLISRINRIIIDMEETSTMLVDLLIEEHLDAPSTTAAPSRA